MACTRDSSYQNPRATEPNTIINSTNNVNYVNCQLSNGFYPNFGPKINTLFVSTSSESKYSLVYINGSNFLPPCYGTTYVNFGSYTNLPIIFYNSFTISFVVPIKAVAGNYSVIVVNIYNNNFSPSVKQSYPGNLNYSNSLIYTIT